MTPPSSVLSAPSVENVAALRAALLAWYDAHARVLPWRAPPGAAPMEAYRVLVSEVMLQQTTVAAVIGHYQRFLERFPTVQALAAATQEEVLAQWAGLGYYSRGRNLHAAAKAIKEAGFPRDEAALRALPGVGAYTAAAVAAIAFNQAATVVDGNVERVVARLFAVETPLPAAKPALRALAARFTSPDRPGDFAQAMMDLGAVICTPRAPKCPQCPVQQACRARALGVTERLPQKAAKAAKPQRFGAAFVLVKAGAVFVVRRPQQGLLAGMAGLPTTPWRETPWTQAQALAAAPAPAAFAPAGVVRHVFTHFALALSVFAAAAPPLFEGDGQWRPLAEDRRDRLGLPTVFAKALERGLAALQP